MLLVSLSKVPVTLVWRKRRCDRLLRISLAFRVDAGMMWAPDFGR